MIIEIFIIFLIGISFGSFLNVVIFRFPKNQDFLRSHSFCPKCQHPLSWKDLLPIISFFLLGGKCRYCKQKISFYYPLIEFLTGFFLCLIFYFSKINFIFFIYLSFISLFLVLVFLFDLKYYIIPDELVLSLIIISLIFNIFFHFFPETYLFSKKPTFLNFLLSAIIASFLFFLLFFFSEGRLLGFGDVKFMIFMGLFLGFPKIILAIFFAAFLGSIISFFLIIKKKKSLKSEIPFGPFLVLGTYISFFWGGEIIDWYLRFLNLK